MDLKALDQARLRRQAQGVQAFWDSPDYDAGLQALGAPDEDNAFRQLAEQGRSALTHLQQRDGPTHLHQGPDVKHWVTRALQNARDQNKAKPHRGWGGAGTHTPNARGK